MRIHQMIVTLASVLFAANVFGADKKATRTTASQKLDALCTEQLKNTVAAFQTPHIEEFASFKKDIQISNVTDMNSSPCAGGADDCMMTTSRGQIGNKDIKGFFIVTAGRGNCYIESLDIHQN